VVAQSVEVALEVAVVDLAQTVERHMNELAAVVQEGEDEDLVVISAFLVKLTQQKLQAQLQAMHVKELLASSIVSDQRLLLLVSGASCKLVCSFATRGWIWFAELPW